MNQFTGTSDTDLEARCADLYQQIMAGFDSLPLATWTPEYRVAIRAIQGQEIEFRGICTELARRLAERAARWNETMDAALMGIIESADSPGTQMDAYRDGTAKPLTGSVGLYGTDWTDPDE